MDKLLLLLIILSFSGCQNKSSDQNKIIDELKGTWYLDCDHNDHAFTVYDSLEASVTIIIHNTYLSCERLEKYDKDNKIYYKFTGMDSKIGLEYHVDNNFYNDKPVIEVEVHSKDTIEFKWLGFYNKNTKKREYTANPLDSSKNSVRLIKCDESLD